MTMKLYVGNLPYSTTSPDLERLFTPYGAVSSAQVIEDRLTGKSKGFGFVEMTASEDGQKAIAALNGKQFEGRTLTVNEARPREDRGGGGGGGGGGGSAVRGVSISISSSSVPSKPDTSMTFSYLVHPNARIIRTMAARMP